MRTSTVFLAIVVLVIAFAPIARAQVTGATCPTTDQDEWSKMWNVRAGAFIPNTTGDLKTAWNFGIEHEHPANRIIKGFPGNFTISADFARFNSFDGVKTRRVTLIPLYLNWKKHYMLPDTVGRSWYWGLGAGVYLAEDDIPEMNILDQSQFAWNAGAGYYFTSSWFGEVRYLASKQPSDSRIFSLDLGYSF